MNIFMIHKDPVVAARAMTDKHVVKMIVESAQLMSTAHRYLDGEMYVTLSKSGSRLKRWNHPTLDDVLYKSCFINHPSGVWIREAEENYMWLYNHFAALCDEYTARYGKIHSTDALLRDVFKNPPKNIPKMGPTPMRVAITDRTHVVPNDPVQSYINYYIAEKLNNPKDTERFYKILDLA